MSLLFEADDARFSLLIRTSRLVKKSMRSYESIWVGATSFQEGERIQSQYREMAEAENRSFLLGFEFQPVISIGKRGSVEKDLLPSAQQLLRRGFEVARSERGGHATLHDEGQLVIYPVVPIRQRRIRLVDFVAYLHRVTQLFLEKFEVAAFPGECPGLYTEQGKIAFFGLRILRGVSQHGLSINVSNDLSAFEGIRSCGKPFERFDRLRDHLEDRLESNVSMEELFFFWSQIAVAEQRAEISVSSEKPRIPASAAREISTTFSLRN